MRLLKTFHFSFFELRVVGLRARNFIIPHYISKTKHNFLHYFGRILSHRDSHGSSRILSHLSFSREDLFIVIFRAEMDLEIGVSFLRHGLNETPISSRNYVWFLEIKCSIMKLR